MSGESSEGASHRVSSPSPPPIRTPRLDLVAATAEVLEAELRGHAELAAVLDARVPQAWPPPLYDEDAVQWALKCLRDDAAFEEWGVRYFVAREPMAGGGAVAVGAGGYKGPPRDQDWVEIGYSVLPEYQRRGFASEAARGLVRHAFRDPRIERVTAETLPQLWPSIGVLEKVGFRFAGEGTEEGAVRYEITRAWEMEGLS